ncbi:thiol-disulfide oxidoreductase DCC family protein [Thalassobacillus pellis]|uniref:thiol-disulfide oxidoreductase DCC family protein n=1 Tax=Thalassobacillus pellis TaxID=748008 RepID=UPI00195FDBE4|nr:DUF393 domain-containing protein [Thalassobacillus pellis]MBM7553816.1 putative DCC family thiol-disulfide oxidoreductase YuxK [Thalassobacillus pellis]
MPHTVFYDAQCPLCYHVKRILQKLDWFNRVQWVAVQEAVDSFFYPFLRDKDVYERIYMQASTGKVLAGFYTIRKLLINIPLTMPLGVLMYFPLASRIGSPLYIWVSKHRHQWFGRYDTLRK